MSKSVEKQIEKLRDELNRANHLYYVEARPSISDREYDRLMAELGELEAAHPELLTSDSPTQRVGGEVQAALKPVKHAVPMMSIDNKYDIDGVRAFDKRMRKELAGVQPKYVLEPKIDGASVSLRYEKGKLVLAATRGRGDVGDDITANARTIKSIPLTLRQDGADVPPPPILEVRGEVYMDNEDFQRVNRDLVAAGEEPYANPRNLTAGTLRRLDPKIVARRRLRFLAHGFGQVDPMPVKSYWAWTQLLKQWGLPLPREVYHVDDVEQAIEQIHAFEKVRPKLPYMTDGIVVKVDDLDQRRELGTTSKAPVWVMAYKYEAEQQPTTLRSVRWQVGKGGTLTPVATMAPTFIAGVTVTHATLHNIDQIKRLDLHESDTIIIERRGEVIPHVADVIVEKRAKGAKRVVPPKVCPSCGTPVVEPAGTPMIRCPNFDCPAQLRERLIWFAGRGQMDIDGLGEKIIEQLIAKGLLRDVGDLYRLKKESIAELTHETQLGEKKAKEIVSGLERATETEPEATWGKERLATEDLRQAIRQLAKRAKIKGLGDKTIDQLIESKAVRSMSDLRGLEAADLAEMTQAVKLGDVSAGKIVEFIEASKSRGLARALAALGIRLIGSTASRHYAEWARDIDVLRKASLEELTSVLAKDPDAQRETEQKERAHAAALYAALHGAPATDALFSEASEAEATPAADTTEAFLVARDAKLAHGTRLGKARIKKLAECFTEVDDLENATEEELGECLAEGRAVASSLYEYLRSERGRQVLDDLAKEGVKLAADAAPTIKQTEWTGKTVVITGSFEGVTRDQLKEKLLSMGAKVSESVSSKTDAVFAGESAGSKLKKAEDLKIAIFGEAEVQKIIGG